MAETGKRAAARAQMEADILAAGRRQLAEHGAAGISLREVARSLGVVSSAVYRYVASRDELLTLLLVDAFTSLADDVDAGLAGVRSPKRRLAVIMGRTRAWAKAHPAEWALAYGSPVPGYAAPEESTGGPGTRVMAALLTVAAAGEPDAEPAAALGALLQAGAAALGVAATPAQALAGVEVWTTMIGTISTELFGQLGPELAAEGDAIAAATLRRAERTLGL